MPDTTWTATCWRDGSLWAVHVRALALTGHAALLSQVEDVARDLLRAAGHDSPSAPARVVVEPLVPPRVRALLEAACRARAVSDWVGVSDVMTRRRLARQLAEEGLPVADIATALGVSTARARMLAGAGLPSLAPAAAPSPSPAAGSRDAHAVVPRPRQQSPPPRARRRVRDPETGETQARDARARHARSRGAQDSTLSTEARGRDHDRSVTAHVPAQDSYRHEALLFRGPGDFLAKSLPFVLDGVERGQPVVVGLPRPRLDALQEALGEAADHVRLIDMADIGPNPARIIPAWLEFLEEHAGAGPVRGLGEPVYPGRSAPEVAECRLHEALLNVAVEPDTPAWLRCAYDVAALDDGVVDSALRSHPLVVDGTGPVGSPRYGGLAYVEDLFTDPLPEPAGRVDRTEFGDGDLAAVRGVVHQRATEAGVGKDRAADLVLAVTELATNSVRHGGGSGVLRTWQQPGALVLEVSDAGRVADPLVGRRAPAWSQEGGRGLWLTNQLCDVVQVRSGEGGTTVRVFASAGR